jgi:hypothetical protein
MGYKIDQAEKSFSRLLNWFLISIAWVRKCIKMIKGQAALTLF